MDGFRDAVMDVRLAEWVGMQGGQNTDDSAAMAIVVVLSSLFVGWLSWKFVMACRLAWKLRRLSRTVPSVR